MFYTIQENFVDNFFKDIYTTKPTNRLNSQFEATTLEDGKQQVTINTIGHNPKDITVDVTEEEITIKSTKGEQTSSFVITFWSFLCYRYVILELVHQFYIRCSCHINGKYRSYFCRSNWFSFPRT